MSEEAGTVTVEERGRTAVVTFARPGVLNALDLATVSALADAYAALSLREDVDVVVLRSGSPGFCSGGDLADVAGRLDDLAGAVDRFLDRSDVLVTTLLTMPQLTVTVVDGAAAGAGISLAAAADVVVCSERSRFHPAYARLGVPPDLGGSLTLARRLGPQRALHLLLQCERVDAATALAWGLADQVVPHDEIEDRVDVVLAGLSGLASAPLRATKALLRRDLDEATVTRALAQERRDLQAAMATPEYVTRVRAFLER